MLRSTSIVHVAAVLSVLVLPTVLAQFKCSDTPQDSMNHVWCHNGQHIRIWEAQYGVNCRLKDYCNGIECWGRRADATGTVRNLCNGLTTCHIWTWDELAGNPAPGEAKRLYVTYDCHGWRRSSQSDGNETVQMDVSQLEIVEDSSSGKAVVAAVAGGVALLLVATAVIVFAVRRRRAAQGTKKNLQTIEGRTVNHASGSAGVV